MTEMTEWALEPSARWSALWGAGMLAIFFGERMIGAGGARAAATVGGLLLVVAAMVVRAGRASRAAPDRRQVERMLLGLYGLGLLAVVLYFAQSDLPTVLGQGQAARARLAAAGHGPGGALAGRLAGGRLADRAHRDGLRADRPRPEDRGRPRPRRDVFRSRPGGGAGVRLHGGLRRLRARQEGRPGLLPHHPPGRGVAPDRPQPRPADRGRRVLPRGERGPRRGRQLHAGSGARVGPAQAHPLRLRHRSR